MKRDLVIMSIAGICTFVVCILILVWAIHRLYKLHCEEKSDIERTKKQLGATMYGRLRHTSGLPIERGVFVEVYYGPEKIIFRNGWQEIIVMRDKITHMDLVIPSNRSKAVYGRSHYGKYGEYAAMAPDLVISYTSGGMNKQIKLDTYGGSIGFPKKVIEDFRRTKPPARMTIEL